MEPAPDQVATHDGQRSQPEVDAALVSDPALAMLRFRNYAPQDVSLKAFVLRKPFVAAELDVGALSAPIDEDATSLSLAPKVLNWDLKRETGRKLEKLEQKTQRAIVELMREQASEELQADSGGGEGGGERLAMAVENAQLDPEDDD